LVEPRSSEGSKVLAFCIDNNKIYDLEFKLPTSCQDVYDYISFKILRGDKGCAEETHVRPTGEISFMIIGSGVRSEAFGLENEVYVEITPTTLRFSLSVDYSTGCEFCDVFYLQMHYIPSGCAPGAKLAEIALVLNHKS
jgi:hypothetical protein